MAESFTDIDLEVKIAGSWVSLWADVKFPVSCSRGMEGNGPLDIVAGPGELKFRLNNAADNSAGLLGRYSPGHANCLSGWTVSLPVRLSFQYDTWTVYKWYGYIDPDGITVMPGSNAERVVEVVCHDFMKQAADHKLNLLQLQDNMYPYQALQHIFANMSIAPLQYELAANDSIFPTVFDASGVDTTALGEFEKISQSTRGALFVQGDGQNGETLIYMGRNAARDVIPLVTADCGALLMETGDNILLENGDLLLLDDAATITLTDADIMPGSQFNYGKHIYNFITAIFYPRRVDTSSVVLWKLNEAKKVPAGETIFLRGQYNDPGGSGNSIRGKDFVTPVSGTDFKANAASDGSGADATASMTMMATFGVSEVEIAIINGSASDFYTGGSSANTICQVRGRGIYFDDPIRIIEEDVTSRNTHGVKPLNVDMKYRNEELVMGGGRTLMEALLTIYKNPQVWVESLRLWANRDSKNMRLFLFGEPFYVIYINETMNGLSGASFSVLLGYEFEIVDNNTVFWTPMFRYVVSP